MLVRVRQRSRTDIVEPTDLLRIELPAGVTINDMDGVNGSDVIVRTDSGVQVFLNDGSGNLASLVPVAATGISNLAIAPLDNKSGPDALMASPTISIVQILRNDRSGNLIENRSRTVTGSPTLVGVGNFDGG